MTFRVLAFSAILATLGMALPASAQQAENIAPGLAYASSFLPVPVGAPINVQPWDNTAENQRVKRSFDDALSHRGVPLTEQRAPLTLNFETQVDSLAGPTSGGVRHRTGESRIRMDLWSGNEERSATTRYILRATLDDQRSGQRLWQGEATYTGAVTDEAATFAAMAPILVDGFGQNLHPKAFRIQ